MNNQELSDFYSNLTINTKPQCSTNEYLIIQTEDKQMIGPYIWTETGFESVPFRTFESDRLGDLKPRDQYQIAYMDSIVRNQITFATGAAGSGKSLIALTYAFEQLDRGNISRIVVFCNPHVAKSAVKLGFLPGDKTEKLLETNIGAVLISKLGDRLALQSLIDRGKIVLMPIGDCRGYEVPEDSFVYFTESQNTNIYLMKLFLQRLNDNCKVIVEGDVKSQVDAEEYQNGSNGLVRAIQVFQNEDYAGIVELKNIYRSRIANKAEEM